MQSDKGLYSAPRWRLTRWLAEPGPSVPDDIRAALIAQLYGSLPVLPRAPSTPLPSPP